MAIKINQNIISLLIQRNLDRASSRLEKTLDRLSSGERIRRSSDDPAALSISQQLRYEIRGLQRSRQNVGNAVNLTGLVDSSLNNVTSMIQRARELVVQAGNDTLSPSDRQIIAEELHQLLDEINRTGTDAAYLGRNLLDGSFTQQQIQVGSGNGQSLALSIPDFRIAALGRIAIATGASAVGAAAIAGGGDLTINGIDVPASIDDGVSADSPATSAIAKAAAINSVESQTGVHATANPTELLAAGATISAVSIDGTTTTLSINGVAIGPVDVEAGDANGALVSAINEQSSTTGVTASLDASGALKLNAADGRNINVTTTGSIADELGLAASDGDLANFVQRATITLTSDRQIGIGAGEALIGFSGAQTTIDLDPSTSLEGLDVSTAARASQSLARLDSALRQVGTTRAAVGALQNRLDGISEGIALQIEELSASDSRIRDTDVALESTRLAQAQILQEASVALLVQANVMPRTVLQLLLG